MVRENQELRSPLTDFLCLQSGKAGRCCFPTPHRARVSSRGGFPGGVPCTETPDSTSLAPAVPSAAPPSGTATLPTDRLARPTAAREDSHPPPPRPRTCLGTKAGFLAQVEKVWFLPRDPCSGHSRPGSPESSALLRSAARPTAGVRAADEELRAEGGGRDRLLSQGGGRILFHVVCAFVLVWPRCGKKTRQASFSPADSGCCLHQKHPPACSRSPSAMVWVRLRVRAQTPEGCRAP